MRIKNWNDSREHEEEMEIINDKWTWIDNKIGDEGVRMISEALKINSTLTELYLKSDKQ